MTKDTFLSFRTEGPLKERLKALAEAEDRTLSQMSLILIREALNERECSDLIRKAEQSKGARQ